jgi:glycosyltransferase involved in cell wall biosynthesis
MREGGAVSANRIAWTGAWSRGHNNARYAELLPRLEGVDRYFVDMHPFWPLRGIRRRVWLPLLTVWLGLRYPLVFSTDWRQLKWIRSRAVVDHDDPLFGTDELRALSAPNVAAVIVTSDAVREQFLALGLRRPLHVIPQGVGIHPAGGARIRSIRAAVCRTKRDIVVGYHAPHFEFADELPEGAQQMYAVDELLAVLEHARRREARLSLWLVGEPSRRVRDFALRNPWVRLPGYKERGELGAYVSAFDIGVYPRRADLRGRMSIKVLEYMACGVPVIGFDVAEMIPVRENQAGMIARNEAAFSAALASLAGGKKLRTEMGAHGRKAGAAFGWDALSGKYNSILHAVLRESDPR